MKYKQASMVCDFVFACRFQRSWTPRLAVTGRLRWRLSGTTCVRSRWSTSTEYPSPQGIRWEFSQWHILYKPSVTESQTPPILGPHAREPVGAQSGSRPGVPAGTLHRHDKAEVTSLQGLDAQNSQGCFFHWKSDGKARRRGGPQGDMTRFRFISLCSLVHSPHFRARWANWAAWTRSSPEWPRTSPPSCPWGCQSWRSRRQQSFASTCSSSRSRTSQRAPSAFSAAKWEGGGERHQENSTGRWTNAPNWSDATVPPLIYSVVSGQP